MTSPRPGSHPLSADPHAEPTPLPLGPALVRGAALAFALGLGAAGCSDTTEPPMAPPRDLGTDGFISPMPPPVDLGVDLDIPSPMPPPLDMGPDETDLGIIAPMPPPLDMGPGDVDLGIIAPMPPPPMPPPPMPPPMPPPA